MIFSLFFGYVTLYIFLAVNLITAFKDLNVVQYVRGKDKFIYFGVFFFLMPLNVSFMMVITCGYLQISSLNKFLEKNLKNSTRVSLPEVFKKSSIIYDKLCDLFDSISSFYALNNLVILTAFTYFYVFLSYDVYVYPKSPSNGLRDYMLSTFLWCIYNTPFVVWMMTFGSWIQSEGCKTVDLIQYLSFDDNRVIISKKCFILTLQLEHRRPKISCGFDINWKTLFTLIVSVFSFSIIIIQFYDVSNN